MKIFQKIILTLCFMGLALQGSATEKENMKLIFAIDLVRHGHRAPNTHLPEISNIWTKEQLGHLMDVGREQATLLGQKFRQYYVDQTHLLPANFQPELLHVRSTYMQRTQDTAKALLRGFYPSESEQIKSFVAPKNEDSLLRDQKKP